ncbi:unnamed protein product [Ceratitis capitata]|uniref:(Mediterranean fruit fly) hypothetical protein n=1 Tax=Ceratitis capitata TaxID=7213 RepID=A0A811UTP2_CERCA|nr:unnamed protein product [Ceratitis capitata]
MPFYPELSFQNPNLYNRPINNVPNGYNRPTNSLQQNAFRQQQSFPNANRNFQPRFQTHQPFQPNFPPPRPMAPKPQRPQPMEIDQSMRTANVNYQNSPRQNQFQGKRPASLNVLPPPYKQQRNFHIGSRQQNLDSEMEYEEEPTANFDENEYFQLQRNLPLSQPSKRTPNIPNIMPFYPELSFQNPNLYNRPINNVPNGYNRPTNSLQQNAFRQQQSFPNANRNFQPRFQTHQPFQPNFPPPRPMAPKSQRPQPMEIDQSMRTANVNYQNRPRQNQFQGKRPASLNVVPPLYKQQRNFHIGSRQQNLDSEMEYQEEPTANFDENEYFQFLQNEDIENYAESYDQMDQQ